MQYHKLIVSTVLQNLNIKSVRLVKDRDTDIFKGFCYVEFEDLQSLEIAIGLNKLISLEGSMIRIDLADDKRSLDKGRGRGGMLVYILM